MNKWLLLACLFAQNLAAQFPIWQDLSTKKHGICNPLTGEPTHAAEFDEATVPYGTDTLVLVKKNGLFGLVSTAGRMVLPLELENVVTYQKDIPLGFVAVRHDQLLGIWGIRAGRQLAPVEFEMAQGIFPDLFAVRRKGSELLEFFDENGQKMFEAGGKGALPGFDKNTVELILPGDKRAFCDKRGRPVFPDNIQNGRWTDGQWVVVASFMSDADARIGHSALLTFAGDTVLPRAAVAFEPVGGGRFLIKSTERNENKAGLFDAPGRQWLVPLSNVSLHKPGPKDDPRGVIFIRKSDGQGRRVQQLLDNNGHVLHDNCSLYPVPYDRVQAMSVRDHRPDRYFLLDTTGKSGSLGLFATDGRLIVPMEYQKIRYFSERHAAIAARHDPAQPSKYLNNAFDLQTGKKLFAEDYQDINWTLSPGKMWVKKAGKWALLKTGEEKYARFDFETLTAFPTGGYMVQKGAQWLLYRADGELAVAWQYDRIMQPTREQYFTFREMTKTDDRLLAVGIESDMPHGWFAISDHNQHFFINPATYQAPPPLTETEIEIYRDPPVPQTEPLPVSTREPAPEKPAPQRAAPEYSLGNEVYNDADLDVYPAFPGDSGLLRFIADNLNYPKEAGENGIQGRVAVTFIVEKDGSFTDLQLVKDIGGGCGQEALRLVRSMPQWTPGVKNGKIVRSKQTLRILFKPD